MKERKARKIHFNLHTKGKQNKKKGDFPAMNLIKKVCYRNEKKQTESSWGFKGKSCVLIAGSVFIEEKFIGSTEKRRRKIS